MPCKVCNTSDIVSIGGIDYCAECSTQSENTIIEVSDRDATFSWRTSVCRSPSPRRETKRENKLYAPWITPEAYNIILWKQVSALIELGASKNLKAAVLHIWALYLQKCEIAFRKDNGIQETPRVGPRPSRRDIKVLYGNRSAYLKKKRCKRKPNKKKDACSEKEDAKEISEPEDSNDKDDLTAINAEVSGNESSVFNDDSITDYTETSGDEAFAAGKPSNKKKIKVKYSSHVRAIKKKMEQEQFKKCRADAIVSQMTLPKTLCFCYLGLIYIEDQFTLSDVIRFANEGRIPYFNAVDCLPSTMKLQYYDIICFTTHNNPDLCKLSMMCAKLVQFLDLPSFKNRSLLPLVCRYVKDLNLPNDLIPIVKNLLVKVSVNDTEWYKKPRTMKSKCFSIPVYENKALAFIIIALKLLFILDGNFEKIHSDAILKINALNQDNKYFVWNEWYQHSAVKEYLFIPEKISFPRFRRIDYLSVDQIISNHPISVLKPPSDDASTDTKNKLAAKFAMKELLVEVAELTEGERRIPTSFPLRSQVEHFLSTWESMTAYKENDGSSFNILNKDFSHTSLDYDISFTHSAEDMKSLLISSLYQSSENVFVSNSATAYEDIVTTTSKYWFKNYTQRHNNNKMKFFSKLPRTFCWLLSFLSRYICTEIGDLYFEVVRIEKLLLFGKQKYYKKF